MSTTDTFAGYTQKTARDKALPYTQRYHQSAVYEEEGIRFFESWVPPEIPVRADDAYIQIPMSGYTGRLDLIAFDNYKNSKLWWVIAVANGIEDPFEDVIPGTILRIPKITTLFNYGVFEVA